jgi:LysM repeat protein
MKLKMPNLKKLAAKFRGAPPRQRTYRASAKRAQPAIDDYDDEERPTTRLSSAFIVVLLLHLVAVGGIYAFNSIKAHRHAQEIAAGPITTPAAAKPVPKPVATADAAFLNSATPAPQTHSPASSSTTTARTTTSSKSTPKSATASTSASASPANAEQQRKAEFLAATRPKTYTVHTGDNPTSIARKLGVSQAELLKVNNIEDAKKLQIGQTLKVPPPKNTAKTDSSG